MNIYIARIIILVLTPVFLLALTTNALSLSWCFGEDGHSEIIGVSSDNCCTDSECNGLRISTSQKDLENSPECGSCIDVYIAKDSEITKRSKNQSFESYDNFAHTNLLVPKFKKDHKFHSPPINETVPRISLAILAHRKVVMLN
jgi:hypothetical protein